MIFVVLRPLLFLCIVLMVPVNVFAQSKKRSPPAVDTISSASFQSLLQQHDGKVLLVNAWATWCKPCTEEIPDLLKLKKKYAEKGFQLIFISADEVEEVDTLVRPTLQKLGVDFLTYINGDSSDEAFMNGLSKKWNGALPASFLYNRKGILVEMMVGGKKFEQFESAILKLLPPKM